MEFVSHVRKLSTENSVLGIRLLEGAVGRSRANHMVVILKVIYIKERVSYINVTVRNDFVLNLFGISLHN